LLLTLKEDAQTSVGVTNLQGQKVASLVNEELIAGKHQLTWTPDSTLPNGVYLMRFSNGRKVFSQKIAIQR